MPYFCLIGQSSRRALSRLTLSGQLLTGAKRWLPVPAAAAAVAGAIGAGAVPGHADEQAAVVAVVGRPPFLRILHQLVEVFLDGRQIELLELLGIVEVLAHGVGLVRMLPQDVQLQLVRPPVAVRGAAAGHRPMGHRAATACLFLVTHDLPLPSLALIGSKALKKSKPAPVESRRIPFRTGGQPIVVIGPDPLRPRFRRTSSRPWQHNRDTRHAPRHGSPRPGRSD